MASSTHAATRSGECGTRESAKATSRVTTSAPQNSTTGPKAGPASQRIHRSAGNCTET